jgi:hypothetical protein
MPKFYVYADRIAYGLDNWSAGSFLGLRETQTQAKREGLKVIVRLHDGKAWEFEADGKWRAI